MSNEKAKACPLVSVFLPIITREIMEDLRETSLIKCTSGNWSWTQEAVDFLCVLNNSRAFVYTLPTAPEPVERVAVEADVRRGPVMDDRISVQLRCLVQRNGDGTVTVTVPRLGTQAWTWQTEAEARMMALWDLVDGT